MTKFNELLQLLHRGKNPYEGFPAAQWAGTWYNDPGAQRDILKRCLEKAAFNAGGTPLVVVEVGSFVGESAIYMAQHLKATGREAVVLCIDTWYAGIDHWKGAPDKIQMHFGRPDFFYKFMANVIQHGCQDMILPVAMDSTNGARLLTHFGIQAHMIYTDASHEEYDVFRDYESYWPLLRKGGVFVVDDVSDHFPGVVKDWLTFADLHKLPKETWDVSGEKIAVVKT